MKNKDLKIALFLAILVNFFLTLWITPLFNLDEGAFSEATREMLVNKDFITTYLNGNLRFDKPILIYWLQALSVFIFGLNEFAFRLPSAIAGSFWAFGIYWFTKRIFEERVGLIAAFLMVTTLQIGLIVKAAIADSLLNMFIAFSMFSLYIYIIERKEKYLLLTFTFIAFGFLTKGPVAILVPLMSYFIFMLINKNLKQFFKDIFNLKGIIIFLIIAMPWYILEFKAQGMKFIEGFFLKHNLQRFDSSFEKHKGSIFYYIPVLLIGLLPWTSLLIRYLASLKEFLKNFYLFGSIWFLFVFIFFSLSGTKLPHYVIYGYTPLFIFMAIKFNKKFLNIPFLMFTILLLLLPIYLHNIELTNSTKDLIIKSLLPYFGIGYFVIILLIFLINLKNNLFTLGFSMIFVLNYIGWIYAHAREFPVKEAALYAKKHNIKKVVMYHLNTPSFNVYAQMLVEKQKPKKGDIVLTKLNTIKNFKYKILFQKGIIVLAKIQ